MELTSSPSQPLSEGEAPALNAEAPGCMLLRAIAVLAAGGGSGGHSVTAEAPGGTGGAAVDGPNGVGSPKGKRHSFGTAAMRGTCRTSSSPGSSGPDSPPTEDAPEIAIAMGRIADGFLGASGELSSGGGTTPTDVTGGTTDGIGSNENNNSGSKGSGVDSAGRPPSPGGSLPAASEE